MYDDNVNSSIIIKNRDIDIYNYNFKQPGLLRKINKSSNMSQMNKQNNKKTSKTQGAGAAKNTTPGGANQMTRGGVQGGQKQTKESF